MVSPSIEKFRQYNPLLFALLMLIERILMNIPFCVPPHLEFPNSWVFRYKLTKSENQNEAVCLKEMAHIYHSHRTYGYGNTVGHM